MKQPEDESKPSHSAARINSITLSSEDRLIRERLRDGAYHLPEYTYGQDLWQYMVNNHPLFGICLAHKLHPVGPCIRILSFLGSAGFGLLITNVIYLLFVLEHQNFDESYYSVQIKQNVTSVQEINDSLTQVDVTSGMIALWTLGSALNAFYDNTIWTIASCQCFMEGGRFERHQRLRVYIIMFLVLIVVAGATLCVLIQAAMDASDANENIADSLHISYTKGAEYYRFLIAYAVELCLSLFIWYPIVAFVLFSGVLGCMRMPVLGGRPYEMRQDEKSKSKTSPDMNV